MINSLATTDVSSSDIKLSWGILANDNDNVVNLRVHHQRMGSQLIQYSPILKSSERSYKITNLESDQQYRVCVMAYHNITNLAHSQYSSECIDVSTSTWHMPVSIGSTVGALMALSVIISIVLLAKCRGKSKPSSRRNSSIRYFSTSHYSSSIDPNMEMSDLQPVSEVDETTTHSEPIGYHHYHESRHGYHSIPMNETSRERSPRATKRSEIEIRIYPSENDDSNEHVDRSNYSGMETPCDMNRNKKSFKCTDVTVKSTNDDNEGEKFTTVCDVHSDSGDNQDVTCSRDVSGITKGRRCDIEDYRSEQSKDERDARERSCGHKTEILVTDIDCETKEKGKTSHQVNLVGHSGILANDASNKVASCSQNKTLPETSLADRWKAGNAAKNENHVHKPQQECDSQKSKTDTDVGSQSITDVQECSSNAKIRTILKQNSYLDVLPESAV